MPRFYVYASVPFAAALFAAAGPSAAGCWTGRRRVRYNPFMLDIPKLQREVWRNKKRKGFNTTDVNLEFGLLVGEVAEAHQAYIKKRPDLGEELADIAIYLLSLAKMLGADLEREVIQKIEKNKRRKYKKINGVIVRTKEG